MARNWGGDGIEKFLLPHESVALRFGNNFLTTRRFGKYHTISSTFEFADLGSILVAPAKQWFWKVFILSFAILLVSLFYMAIRACPVNFGLVVAPILVGIFTIANAYYFYRLFCLGVFQVRSRASGGPWKIRTMRSSAGLAFVDELLKASKAARAMEDSSSTGS